MLSDIDSIRSSVKELISAYEKQKVRADRLEEELEKMRKAYSSTQEQNRKLEDKVDNLGLMGAMAGNAYGNAEAKEQIESLIRDIDEALELLR